MKTLLANPAHIILLPLLPELADHLFWGEIQVDFSGGQAVMAQEALQGRQRDVLPHRRDCQGSCDSCRRPRDVTFPEGVRPSRVSARGFAT